MTQVVSFGEIPTRQGPAFALLALRPDGSVEVEVSKSWASAAAALASRLTGPVGCDPALTTIGRRHGWSVMERLDEEVLSMRATVALSLWFELGPKLKDDVAALVEAWREFFPLELWEDVPAEVALPVVHRKGRTVHRHALGILGQGGEEHGVALYEDPADFSALWSGGRPRGTMMSVMVAAPSPLLTTAFAPLGVPPPFLFPFSAMKPRRPTRDDFRLMTGALRLLGGLHRGVLSVMMGPNDSLEFERTAAPARRSAKANPRKKAPATKAPPKRAATGATKQSSRANQTKRRPGER